MKQKLKNFFLNEKAEPVIMISILVSLIVAIFTATYLMIEI